MTDHDLRAERETLFLVRRPSGWYLPRPAVVTPRAPQRGFDAERPGWLSQPDFTPVDTSQPTLAGPEAAGMDLTRPELWMTDDGEFSPDGRTRLSLFMAMVRSFGRRLAHR